MCRNAIQSRTTFLISQIALLVFSLLQLPMRLYPQFHPDLMDGVRGLFLGVAIGAVILTARRSRRPTA